MGNAIKLHQNELCQPSRIDMVFEARKLETMEQYQSESIPGSPIEEADKLARNFMLMAFEVAKQAELMPEIYLHNYDWLLEASCIASQIPSGLDEERSRQIKEKIFIKHEIRE